MSRKRHSPEQIANKLREADVPIGGATTRCHDASESGSYRCKVSNTCGSTYSAPIEFTLGSIVASAPPNNAIDARQPSSLGDDCADTPGWDSLVITFDCSASGLGAADFNVTTNPTGSAPTISNVVPNGNDITLNLSGPIPPGKWAVFTHNASGTSTRLGYLPADVNNDRTASPVDIPKLVDSLNGVVQSPHMIWQTDIDRSGAANPADILRVIDLLNGADCYEVWNGVSLPE
ncbi:MAG: hypothetical protein A49_23880 [Methyloceanibacter sp.]|nr:MAG: hypothetical protein A49_23880 [Methyloceanibacter sp.]